MAANGTGTVRLGKHSSSRLSVQGVSQKFGVVQAQRTSSNHNITELARWALERGC